LEVNTVATEFRKSGISVVGDVPWGTHFCHFYETKQDLLDTLVPYFKAGLESREFCLWVVSDSDLITVEEAKGALAQAVPDLQRHISDENIEILDGHDWYFEQHGLNLERAKHEWDAKLKRALARGYEGLRASADTFWLAEKDWKDFFAYEKQVNDWITNQSMTVMCTYPLAKSGATEVLDVVQAHQFAIARRQGVWEVIETPELIQAKAEIKRLNEELENRVDQRTKELAATNEELRNEIAERKRAEILLHAKELALEESQWLLEEAQRIAHVGHYVHDLETGVIIASDENYRILGLQPQDSIRLSRAFELIHPDDRARVHQERNEAVRTGQHFEVEFRMVRPDGEVRYIHSQGDVIRDELGQPQRTFGIAQDITERKLAEEELKKEKEVLEKIFDNIPVLIGFVGEDGRVKLVNPEWERTIGWTLKELQDQSVDIFAEAYPDLTYRQKVLDFVAASTGEWVDLKIRVRDGRVIDAACAVVDLSDGTKVAIAQDITERKRSEDALRRSEDRNRLIIDTIPTMAWSIRPYGAIDFVNQRWMDYTGLSLEEESEEPMRPIHPEDAPRVMERWLVEMEVGEAYEEEMRIRRADGEYRWFLVRTAPLRDEQGNLVKWYGVATDIEDLKRADAALKESQRRLEEAQRIAHVGHWDRDLETRRIMWSDEIYRILGLPLEERDSPRTEWLEVVHPEDSPRLSLLIQEAERGIRRLDTEFRIVRPNGDVRFLHSQGDVIRDERDRPVHMFGTAQDITEHKRAEEQLKATNEQLRSLSASLQSAREDEGIRIARELHDELGAALSSLRWDLEGFDEGLSEAGTGPQLQELRQKRDAMMRLTDSTITTVRRIASELRPFALDDVGLTEAIEWQARQFQERTGIIVQCDCTLENVYLNREQSTAAFRISQEALTNILRHAEATKVHIRMKKEDGEFILTIADNGRGITDDEKSGQRTLGLLGMRERAHLVGGKIDITGSDGKGTAVTVRIPISG
jgi:PAS domain S-box-containing protein